ncbi:MAG: fused MFS/spermidine synthase, partial [Thermoleophilia bacterium]
MSRPIFALIYLLFFLSGAAALIYEVVWFRSISLIFGASHLAVATVLFVFMGGLALGSHLLGKRVEQHAKPLRLYGFLEVGIAVFAVLFVLLMKLYPYVYVPLARLGANNTLYISSLRIVLAVVCMVVPTTLMGRTLPVLSRLVSSGPERLGARLSFLYSFNTIGAVAGTLAAGFLLLPYMGVNVTLAIAIGINLAIGLSSIALQDTVSSHLAREAAHPRGEKGVAGKPETFAAAGPTSPIPYRFVLWGIGISGFCALGYEVLWTRVLSMVIGTTVYGFTIMLAAFLSGIASGSGACGLFLKIGRGREGGSRFFAGFGLVQFLIGVTALLVTYTLRDLPAEAIRIQNLILGTDISEFEVRLVTNFLVAFCYMFLPAFFMGVAFPLAGTIHAEFRNTAGSSVGEVLTWNTIGAILGASLSGFVLIYLFGIERSLQILVALNMGTGLLIAASTAERPLVIWGAAAVTVAVLLALAINPDRWKSWDTKYFAIYRNNQRDAFDTPGKFKDAMENTDVLFFREGINETISVIKVKGASQALLVNGKVVASSMKQDIQCQMALGHLPVLLHGNPRRVWVLGLGTGMTLGAVSVHPEVERVTLAEIEPNVLPAARTFSRFNHDVL